MNIHVGLAMIAVVVVLFVISLFFSNEVEEISLFLAAIGMLFLIFYQKFFRRR
jgi:4-hydroxybenzoate polyprenyltransferase